MELSCLVAYDRHSAAFYRLLEIGRRIRIFMIDETAVECVAERERTSDVCVIVSPSLASDTAGGEVIHAVKHSLITEIHVRSECVEAACSAADVVVLAEVCHVISHHFGAAP